MVATIAQLRSTRGEAKIRNEKPGHGECPISHPECKSSRVDCDSCS